MKGLAKLSKKLYEKDIALWARDRLGLDPKLIEWASLGGAYEETGRVDENGELVPEAWDGTPDPFSAAMKALVEWKNVGLESATGTGKTYWAAVIMLWFLDVFGDPDDIEVDCLVITLAPKEDQLKLNLWKEVRKLWPRFKKLHPEAEIMQTLEIRMRPNRKNWFAFGYPVGVGADEAAATKVQGFHGEHMLFILEETPGIPTPVMVSVKNTSISPHNLILALGNPDGITDPLHQFCLLPTTEHIRISALDHPNYVFDDHQIIKGAVSLKSVENRLAEYKEATHPMYMSRVRGICPDTTSMCLFPGEALARAKKHIRTPIEVFEHSKPSEGKTSIYYECQPTHLNRYLLHADVAGDRGKGDWHVGIMYDRLKHRPSAVIRMRGPREDFITELLRVCDLYKIEWRALSQGLPNNRKRYFHPLLSWEKTGVGGLILDERMKKYPNLYHSRNIEIPDANTRASVGWDTSARSRKHMIDALEAFGLDLYDRPYRVVDLQILEEMRSFVWTKKGQKGRFEAAPNSFDDSVMSLGGCLLIDSILPKPEPQDKIQPEPLPTHWDRHLQKVRKTKDSWQDDGAWSGVRLPNTF